MFADVMKMTVDEWAITNAASVGYPFNESGTLPPMDANGYPIGLGNLPANGEVLDTFVFTNNGGHYPTGTYTLTFDGSGTVEIVDGGADAPQNFTQNGGLGSPHNVTISATEGEGILIAITSSDPADYVRNIRLVIPGCQNTYQTQPFNPQYLSALQGFSYLRFLNPMQINSPTQQVGMTWAQETPIPYRTQAKSTGISVQYMVDLCNTLNENMWVNMPVGADSTYLTNFATYVCNNLNPGLKVYVEYGGEVWSNAYANQYAYVSSYATANNLTYPQATANLTAGAWNIWRQVFAGQTSRMVRVVGSQFSWTTPLGSEIAQLVATSSPSDPDHGFDVIAGGAYFGPDTSSFTAQTTVSQIEAAEIASLPSFKQALNAYMDTVTGLEVQLGQQIPVIMYEGGLSLAPETLSVPWYNAFIATQTDPGQGPITAQYLADLANAGVTGVNYYSFIWSANLYGEWGSMDYLGEPSAETPKYNALMSFINSPSLAFTGFPEDDIAGNVENITVIAYGPGGSGVNTGYSGTVAFSSSDPQASLPAAYTFTPADAGVHTFTIVLKSAGTQSITVADLAGQLTLSQTNINVQPAAASSLRLTISLTNVVAGVPDNMTVTAYDAYSNVATSYAGTLQFTSTDSQAVLPANYTFTSEAQGTFSFTATLNTPGTQSITATDTNSPTISSTEFGIVVQSSAFSDAGFEQPSVGAGQFQYQPTGSPWTFTGSAGISANNSGFTAGNPPAPEGTQVTFLQGTSSFSQSVTGWPAGSYAITFDAAQRGNHQASHQDFQVLVDNTIVGTYVPSGTSYQSITTNPFIIMPGTHTITFQTLDSAGGDNTAFIDAVTVAMVEVPTPGDAGFEQPAVGAGQFQYDPTGSPWTFTGLAGISANNSGFTAGNPPAPVGLQVGFLQETGSFNQSVTGWAAGSYTINFLAAQRGNHQASQEDFNVLVDGVVVSTFTPSGASYQSYSTPVFNVTSGSHTIAFQGLDSTGGDNTVFVDTVTVATAEVSTLGDAGFEQPSVGAGQFQYQPTGSPWTFTGSAGISANNSGFTAGNPPAPEGTQVAFLQGTSSFSQSVTGWPASSYAITFDAAQRSNHQASHQDFQVLVDNAIVGTYVLPGTSYQSITTNPFTITPGTHTITFQGLDSAGGDNTAFVDNVTVAVAMVKVPTLGDAGFEQPSVGAGQFQYDPTGSAWTFTGLAGISANNSGFTAGNPPAPEGLQVAFLQETGSFSQSVTGWAAGSYTINFLAAQRGNHQASQQDFNVLVDGVVVGTFTPSGTSYQSYSTSAFNVTSGSHTIVFQGLDSAGGDNTVFIDNVTISLA
jgi:hypothetical protein